MGSFLDKPKTDKTNSSDEGNNLRYGLSSMQGWRIEMEDAHCAFISLPVHRFDDWSFFAVFDGHAGAKVSHYCSQHLLEKILNSDNYFYERSLNSTNFNITNNNVNDTSTSSASSSSSFSPTIKSTSPSSSLSVSPSRDQTTVLSPNKIPTQQQTNDNIEKIKNAIVKGFLNLDDTIRKLPEFSNGEDKSGSTAVACLINPQNIYLINCGDSRAILVRDNEVVLNTNDHKPVNPEERERIQKAGGSVMIQRVNGSLAVSRALGDFEYKMVDGMGPTEQLVSPEPEIYTIERSSKDEFIVLACDGIWDVMSNDDIKDFIRARLKVTSNLVQISNEVLDTCLYKGSRDNMSIIIIAFPGAPKTTEADIENDKILDQKLEAKIKEEINNCNPKPDLAYVLRSIAHETWDNLPPGGGLCAKQRFIIDIFHSLLPTKDDECHNNSFSPS